MHCPSCNHEVPVNAKFCNHCGAKIESQGRTCPNQKCQRSGLPQDAVYCPDCRSELCDIKTIKKDQQISNQSIHGNHKLNSFEAFTEKFNAINIEMLPVTGGEFTMGQSDPNIYCDNYTKDEQPQHKVVLDNFLMSKFPVTIYQFKKFINDTRFETSADKKKWSNIWVIKRYWLGTEYSYGKKENLNWQFDLYGKKWEDFEFNHPVIHISWYDANEFCKWLTLKTGIKYRLPTEAEWEYAAGKGIVEKLTYTWEQVWAGTTDINDLGNFLWMDSNANDKPHPVGLKKANILGLHDMCGNVYEWCNDWYDDNYYSKSPKNNPKGPEAGTTKVIRGGCFHNDHRWCRIAARSYREVDGSFPDVGFRIIAIP